MPCLRTYSNNHSIMTCAQCPVSLLCQAGLLTRFTFCPKCTRLQVELKRKDAYEMHYTYEDDPTDRSFWVPEEIETIYIDCPMRFMETEQYDSWLEECDRAHEAREAALVETETASGEPVRYRGGEPKYHAFLLIRDPGPSQHHPRRGSPGMLLCKLCNDCYGIALAQEGP